MTREQLQKHRESHTKINSWWLKDAMGIECSRICDACESAAMREYQLEVFDADSYREVVDEPIDD